MEFKGRMYFSKNKSWCSQSGRKEEREQDGEKDPFESVSLKLQNPGGSGQEDRISPVCLSVLLLVSYHHPQWFSTAHDTFLTHILLYIPAPICIHWIFTVNTRARSRHIFKVASMLNGSLFPNSDWKLLSVKAGGGTNRWLVEVFATLSSQSSSGSWEMGCFWTPRMMVMK